jgi:antitoxin PrlF
MPYERDATLTSKGQVTVPAEIRDRLDVKAGDRLRFHLDESGRLTITPIRRRSIFERLHELELPSLGRPVTDQDIADAVAEAMREQEERVKKQRPR